MKNLKLFLLSVSLFSLSSYAEQIVQTKGKLFIFTKDKSQFYKNGNQVKFYDQNNKVLLIAKIQKCNSTKCKAVMVKRRRGFKLVRGVVLSNSKHSPQVRKPIKSVLSASSKAPSYQYAVRGGLGGQNSATAFLDFDYIFSDKWVFGAVVSDRVASRSDLKVSGIGFGLRADYHFSSFQKTGFFATLGLGMATLNYKVVNIDPTITQFSTSETVPYMNLMGGYKKWFKSFYMNFAGGLSYIQYKATFEDPNNGAVFTNPYVRVDLGLEISLAYPF